MPRLDLLREMRRRLAIAATLVCALGLGAAGARAEIAQQGTTRITFDGGFAPKVLPRRTPAPITVRIEGGITTTDGSHPPPLRRLQVELNRAGTISGKGLPACSAALLQATSSATALERCRVALVGGGSFQATLATGAPTPAGGEVLVFNGGRGNRTELLLHFSVKAPIQTTLVLPLIVHRRSQGQFGTVMSTRIPRLAAGLGSITSIKLRIGRRFGYRGQRRGYISAACAAPRRLSGRHLPLRPRQLHLRRRPRDPRHAGAQLPRPLNGQRRGFSPRHAIPSMIGRRPSQHDPRPGGAR